MHPTTLLVVGVLACTGDKPDTAPVDTTPTTSDTAGFTPPTGGTIDSDDTDTQATDTTDTAPRDTGDTAVPAGLIEAKDPGHPGYPKVIDTVSVTITTDVGSTDGTDDALYLCLTASKDLDDCLLLDNPDLDDHVNHGTSVFHIPGVELPRAEVTGVSLAIDDGSDRYAPHCVDVRLDGEPVYCNDSLSVELGNQDWLGEVMRWTDPSGLHQACTACYGDRITHGPMQGAIGPTEANFVVRADATRSIALYAGQDPSLKDAVVVDYAYPSPADDFTATLTARGATPGVVYHYALGVDGEVPASATGSFTASPPDGEPSEFRLAFGSCAATDGQPIFAHVEDREPDMFLFVGDAHYADSGEVDALRWYWRWSWERPERASMMASTPTMMIWDDHDFIDNDSAGADFDRYPPQMRENALKVLQEYSANAHYGTKAVPGAFSRLSRGDVDIFLADGRYHRTDWAEPNPVLLGDDQLQWLIDELAASTATFKVVATGSQWTPYPTNILDSYWLYPDERDAFFQAIIDEGIEGVVLLSGDVHKSEFRLIDRADDGGYDLPELTSSSMAYYLPAPCFWFIDMLECFDDGFFFITVDFDTTLPDPAMFVTIVDEDGTDRASWTVHRSSLEL